MLDFVRERKALESLEKVSDGLVARVSKVTPIRRAAALAVANATLIAAARDWGKEVSHAPMKMSRKTSVMAVGAFADKHARLSLSSETLQGRPSADPAVDAFVWDLTATEVLIVTLGAVLDRGAAKSAGECWKLLWSARREAENAARLMMHFSKAYSTSTIPVASKKEQVTEKKLMTLASVLPPMYRPKAKSL